jgi:hypothetical protein
MIYTDMMLLEGIKLNLKNGEHCCADITVTRVTAKDPVEATLRSMKTASRRRRSKMVNTNDYGAELRCIKCGKHRGWLEEKTISALRKALAVFPEAKTDVHVIRDSLSLEITFTQPGARITAWRPPPSARARHRAGT